MKKFFLSFIVAFCLALPITCNPGITPAVQAQEVEVEPVFKVSIQDECEVGELVRMTAEGDVEGIRWEIKPATPDFEVIEDGRRALFSARQGGEFLIIVAAAKDGKPFLYYQTLTVDGGVQTPVSDLSRKVATWLKRLPKDTPKAKIRQVAGVFRKLANSDTAVEKMLEATALANSAVIGDDLDKWVPFLDGLGNELDAMVDAGNLKTREQYRSTWLEIAAALDKGAK
jgi:hypothetical protein